MLNGQSVGLVSLFESPKGVSNTTGDHRRPIMNDTSAEREDQFC